MVTTLSLASLSIAIEHEHAHIARQCAAYLTDAPPDIQISVTPEMIARERAEAPAMNAGDGYHESVAAYREIARHLPAFDALVLHAAVIEVGGRAYAFTARSGTGKSTHIRLWRDVYGDRVRIVNGDKPILRFGEDGVLYAYGTPWAGKEGWHRNVGVPLSAIVILERGTQDEIRDIPKQDAVSHLLSQILLGESPSEVFASLGMLDRVLAAVKTKILYCTPTEQAARVAFAALTSESLKENE